MLTCTFFGHRECYDLDGAVLRTAIEDFIKQGVDVFYVGSQGQFDRMVYGCLKQLQRVYPYIRVSVVLAYLPTRRTEYDLYADCSIYPEGLELRHPKFAIEGRNRWMIAQSDHCICYITHTWGGAYQFARLAKQQGLKLRNLGNSAIL